MALNSSLTPEQQAELDRNKARGILGNPNAIMQKDPGAYIDKMNAQKAADMERDNFTKSQPEYGTDPNAMREAGRLQGMGAEAAGRTAYAQDWKYDNAARGQQQTATSLALNAAQGNAPSQAQILGRQMAHDSINSQMSMAAGARGGPLAQMSAMRRAQQGQAGQMAQNQTQMAGLRANEMATARGQAIGATAQQRAQEQGRVGMQTQNEQFQRGLNQNAQMGYEQMAQGVNQTVYQGDLQNKAIRLGDENSRRQADAAAKAAKDQKNAAIIGAGATIAGAAIGGPAGAAAGGAAGGAIAGSDDRMKEPADLEGWGAEMPAHEQSAYHERQGGPVAARPAQESFMKGSIQNAMVASKMQPKPDPGAERQENEFKRGLMGDSIRRAVGAQHQQQIERRNLMSDSIANQTKQRDNQLAAIAKKKQERSEALSSFGRGALGAIAGLGTLGYALSDEKAKERARMEGYEAARKDMQQYSSLSPGTLREMADSAEADKDTALTARAVMNVKADAARQIAGQPLGARRVQPVGDDKRGAPAAETVKDRAPRQEPHVKVPVSAPAAPAVSPEAATLGKTLVYASPAGLPMLAGRAVGGYFSSDKDTKDKDEGFIGRLSRSFGLGSKSTREMQSFRRDRPREPYAYKPGQDHPGEYEMVSDVRGKQPAFESDERQKRMGGSVRDSLEADANRRMEASPYRYKDEFTPPEQAEGELNYGPMAQELEKNPITRTAVKQDPQTTLRVVDIPKLVKVQSGAIASLQEQIDALRGRGKKRYAHG